MIAVLITAELATLAAAGVEGHGSGSWAQQLVPLAGVWAKDSPLPPWLQPSHLPSNPTQGEGRAGLPSPWGPPFPVENWHLSNVLRQQGVQGPFLLIGLPINPQPLTQRGT